jgi:hypothetical protein
MSWQASGGRRPLYKQREAQAGGDSDSAAGAEWRPLQEGRQWRLIILVSLVYFVLVRLKEGCTIGFDRLQRPFKVP